MNHRGRRIGEAGFTLVELLIVVIILAVLAAIVVPQFASSTTEAKEAALKSSLAEMRNAIELYYHQHRGTYPGRIKADGTVAASAAEALTAFTAQITLYSDANGKTANIKDLGASPPIKYGPYLKKASLPVNPVDDSSDLEIVFSGAAGSGDLTKPTDAVGANGGWWFDVVSGKFIANTAGTAEDNNTTYISF